MVDKINMKIQPGMNVIVTGGSGCGKSSLFRGLGGLWPVFKGQIYRPDRLKLFYIP